jgi:hypothetical protein
MDEEFARWHDWIDAHTYIWPAIQSQLGEAMESAIWTAIDFEEAITKRPSKQEINDRMEAAKKAARLKTPKSQAALLREILKNPFRPRMHEDFEQ